jgi:hypothetical protein
MGHMAKTLQWEYDDKIPITMSIDTIKYFQTHWNTLKHTINTLKHTINTLKYIEIHYKYIQIHSIIFKYTMNTFEYIQIYYEYIWIHLNKL